MPLVGPEHTTNLSLDSIQPSKPPTNTKATECMGRSTPRYAAVTNNRYFCFLRCVFPSIQMGANRKPTVLAQGAGGGHAGTAPGCTVLPPRWTPPGPPALPPPPPPPRRQVAGVVSITFMVLFFVFVTTGQINWWQSLIFVLVYSLYVLVMKYNEELGELLYPVAKDGEGRPLLPPSSLLAHATSLSPNSSGSFPVPSGSSKDFPRPGGLTVTHSADQLAQPTSAGRSASLLGAPPSPMSGANPLGKSHSWCHGFQPDDWDVVELGPLLPNRRLTPLPAALYAPLSHERRQSLMFGDVVTKECHPLVEVCAPCAPPLARPVPPVCLSQGR